MANVSQLTIPRWHPTVLGGVGSIATLCTFGSLCLRVFVTMSAYQYGHKCNVNPTHLVNLVGAPINICKNLNDAASAATTGVIFLLFLGSLGITHRAFKAPSAKQDTRKLPANWDDTDPKWVSSLDIVAPIIAEEVERRLEKWRDIFRKEGVTDVEEFITIRRKDMEDSLWHCARHYFKSVSDTDWQQWSATLSRL